MAPLSSFMDASKGSLLTKKLEPGIVASKPIVPRET